MTEEALRCPFCGFIPPPAARVCRGCGAEIRHGGQEGGAGCGCALVSALVSGLALKVVADEFFHLNIEAVPTWVQWTVIGAGALAGLSSPYWFGGANRGRGGRPRVRFVRRTQDGRQEELDG